MIIFMVLPVITGSQLLAAMQLPRIAEVVDAWTARQDRIKSARFTWEETEFIKARTLPSLNPSEELDEFLPPEDVIVKRTATLFLEGGMMRYSYEGEQYNPFYGGVQDKKYDSATDGQVSKNFHEDDKESDTASDFPIAGFIHKTAAHADFDNWGLLPLFLTCRPVDVEMGGVNLDEYEVGTRVADIGGRQCHLIQPKVRDAETHSSYWVDPSRDFVVTRVMYGRAGKPPIFVIDVDYSLNPSGDFVPTGWKQVNSSGHESEVRSQFTISVMECIINEEIGAVAFQLEFPPNTAVVDNRSGEKYIAKENGEKRLVTQHELKRGATYQDLVSTNSGEAAAPQLSRSNRPSTSLVYYLNVTGILITIVALGAWIVRKRRSRH